MTAIGEKSARCVHIGRWRKSLAIFAGFQIRRDRRLKSPALSRIFVQVVQLSIPYIENLADTFHTDINWQKINLR